MSPRSGKGASPSLACLLVCCCTLLGACGRPSDLTTALAAGDFHSARAIPVALAGTSHASAQNQLGILYYLGLGGPVDHLQAVEWFKRAALAGDSNAQRNLGSMFRQGLGVPHDDIRAFGWYDAARRHGNPRAVNYMRWMTQFVGWNQQAYARRIIADDLKHKAVSVCGAGLLMSACVPPE